MEGRRILGMATAGRPSLGAHAAETARQSVHVTEELLLSQSTFKPRYTPRMLSKRLGVQDKLHVMSDGGAFKELCAKFELDNSVCYRSLSANRQAERGFRDSALEATPEELLVLSTDVSKRNRWGMMQKRALLVTNFALYNCMSNTFSECRRRIPLQDLEDLLVVEGDEEAFVVHVHNDKDYHIACADRPEVISVIRAAFENLVGRSLSSVALSAEQIREVANFKRDKAQRARRRVRNSGGGAERAEPTGRRGSLAAPRAQARRRSAAEVQAERAGDRQLGGADPVDQLLERVNLCLLEGHFTVVDGSAVGTLLQDRGAKRPVGFEPFHAACELLMGDVRGKLPDTLLEAIGALSPATAEGLAARSAELLLSREGLASAQQWFQQRVVDGDAAACDLSVLECLITGLIQVLQTLPPADADTTVQSEEAAAPASKGGTPGEETASGGVKAAAASGADGPPWAVKALWRIFEDILSEKDVVWMVLASACTGRRVTDACYVAMCEILIGKVSSPAQAVGPASRVDLFGKVAKNGAALGFIMSVAGGACLEDTARIMKDLNMFFLRKPDNVMALLRIPNWADSVWPVIAPLPRHKKDRTELEDDVIKYTINMLAIVFLYVFRTPEAQQLLQASAADLAGLQAPQKVTGRASLRISLVQQLRDAAVPGGGTPEAQPHKVGKRPLRYLLCSTFESIAAWAGWTTQAAALVRQLLTVLIGKIETKSDILHWKTDATRQEWQQTLEVAMVLQEFIFHHPTAHLAAPLDRADAVREVVLERASVVDEMHEHFFDCDEDELALHLDLSDGKPLDIDLVRSMLRLLHRTGVEDADEASFSGTRAQTKQTLDRMRRIQKAFGVFADTLEVIAHGNTLSERDLAEVSSLIHSFDSTTVRSTFLSRMSAAVHHRSHHRNSHGIAVKLTAQMVRHKALRAHGNVHLHRLKRTNALPRQPQPKTARRASVMTTMRPAAPDAAPKVAKTFMGSKVARVPEVSSGDGGAPGRESETPSSGKPSGAPVDGAAPAADVQKGPGAGAQAQGGPEGKSGATGPAASGPDAARKGLLETLPPTMSDAVLSPSPKAAPRPQADALPEKSPRPPQEAPPEAPPGARGTPLQPPSEIGQGKAAEEGDDDPSAAPEDGCPQECTRCSTVLWQDGGLRGLNVGGSAFCPPCHDEAFGKMTCYGCYKEILSTEDYVADGAMRWHASHFLCESCGADLTNLEFDVVDYHCFCASCLGATEAPAVMCHSCQQPVNSDGVEALGRIWHREHFTCVECDCPLTDGFYAGERVEGRGEEIMCKEHFMQLCLPSCTRCGETVQDGLRACDGVWHAECFRCDTCDKVLTDEFFEEDGRPYCEEHAPQMIGNHVCASCGEAIDGRYIDVDDLLYHPSCFTCSVCDRSIVDSFWTGEDGNLLCTEHFEEQCERCFACGNAIVEAPVVTALDHSWHRSCLRCGVAGCSELLTSESVFTKEGLPGVPVCERHAKGAAATDLADCPACGEPHGSDDAVIFADQPWHVNCFLCSHCKCSLLDREIVMVDGAPWCGTCHDEVAAPRCATCEEPILDGKALKLLGHAYHATAECFSCRICAASLVGKDRVFEERGWPVCESCEERVLRERAAEVQEGPNAGGVEEARDPSGGRAGRGDGRAEGAPSMAAGGPRDAETAGARNCPRCGEAVGAGSRYMALGDRIWHHDCFACCSCAKSLLGEPCTLQDGQPICKGCFVLSHAERCATCGEPITEGRSTSILGKAYHGNERCFVCFNCGVSLADVAGIYDRGGWPACGTCMKLKDDELNAGALEMLRKVGAGAAEDVDRQEAGGGAPR